MAEQYNPVFIYAFRAPLAGAALKLRPFTLLLRVSAEHTLKVADEGDAQAVRLTGAAQAEGGQLLAEDAAPGMASGYSGR